MLAFAEPYMASKGSGNAGRTALGILSVGIAHVLSQVEVFYQLAAMNTFVWKRS